MWRPGKWKREAARLRTQLRAEQDRRIEAEQHLDASRTMQAVQVRARAEAQAAAERTAARNECLTDLLARARVEAGDGEIETLMDRRDRLVRACARYRAELALLLAGQRSLTARLRRAEDRARALDARLLQQRDEDMARDAATAPESMARPWPGH